MAVAIASICAAAVPSIIGPPSAYRVLVNGECCCCDDDIELDDDFVRSG